MDWHKRFLQQARWTFQARQYLFRKAGMDHAERVLDVGCGTGALLEEPGVMQETRIHGLDISRENLEQAKFYAPSTDLVEGDAYFLPYASSTYDIVFCHFLMLWIRHPNQVVGELKRVVKNGGWVLLLAEPDYGGRIDFPEELAEVGKLQSNALRDQGADPETGRKLAQLLNSAGLAEIETGVLGGQWNQGEPAIDRHDEWRVIRSDLSGRLSEAEINRLEAIDARAWESGERVLYIPTFYGCGKKD
ncbi:MAG: methyltransferase domain-containing protein [Chloroflexi bacterium]|nr:MAG: methyltransferase domain-containing protein [Chloroflexota bacterium]